MALTSILSHGTSLLHPPPVPISLHSPPLKHTAHLNVPFFSLRVFPELLRPSIFRIRSIRREGAENNEAAKDNLDSRHDSADETIGNLKDRASSLGSPFLLLLAGAVGVAAILTITSASLKWPSSGSSFGVQCLAEGSQSSLMSTAPVGFSFKAFGYRIMLPEYAPGWIYFWLLMAAGCGLFISEEALNVWVGISLSRKLSLDGTWSSFLESFTRNGAHVISTVLWIYWGVCISDMIPFYLGKLFRQSGASQDVCSKLGIGEEKVVSITQAVQKHGNLIGIVERFSLGARNPTAFLAGTLGISPECFFAGVCCGGLITLPLQLGVGFLLRERPVFALATVATVVGMWTVLPYAMAASTALFLYLRHHYST
ncbi:hypothetical protein K2173_012832 [Erythroxylum novogranatense]|uniref:Uncharacterized protein n=1 Tax=Erythroxylum novogranatense TaxID=1862640 RepID=A0AAV8UB23_9ROSI|nr:hypothetical protein K2173_012832 [Erythroxylum novogranatense]